MNRKINLTIQNIVPETDDTVTIVFNHPKSRFNYFPGQYITLILQIKGIEYRRAYSLSSIPNSTDFPSITVKRIVGGIVSNHLNDNAEIGDSIEALPPMGNFIFVPSANNKKNVLLIGGGSGITPLFSILKSALSQDTKTIVYLIYINKSRSNTIFYKELELLKSVYPSRLQITYYWSEEIKMNKAKRSFFSWFKRKKQQTNRFTKENLLEILKNYFPDKPTIESYICGPEGLMTLSEKSIKNYGFHMLDVHKEKFGSHSKTKFNIEKSNEVTDVKVRIKFNNKEFIINAKSNKSILNSGLNSGLDLPFSCQSGNCSTCMAKCNSGKIDMTEISGLTNEQLKQGYILTCVAYPKSDDIELEFN